MKQDTCAMKLSQKSIVLNRWHIPPSNLSAVEQLQVAFMKTGVQRTLNHPQISLSMFLHLSINPIYISLNSVIISSMKAILQFYIVIRRKVFSSSRFVYLFFFFFPFYLLVSPNDISYHQVISWFFYLGL